MCGTPNLVTENICSVYQSVTILALRVVISHQLTDLAVSKFLVVKIANDRNQTILHCIDYILILKRFG